MRKILVVITLIFMMCFCNGCGNTVEMDTNKYKSYLCYDYHLSCLDVDKGMAEYFPEGDLEYFVSKINFRKIKDESDNQFIHATVLPKLFLGASQKVILQNPDDYIDVLGEWTITKIELFYVDYNKPIEQNKMAIIPNRVVGSTTDEDVASDVLEFVSADNYTGKVVIPEGYVNEYYDENDGKRYIFFIRIYFNESDTIVWDSEIKTYFSDELQDRIVLLDNGNTVEEFSTPNNRFVKVENQPKLLEWLDETLPKMP